MGGSRMYTGSLAMCPVCGDEGTPPAWGSRSYWGSAWGKQGNQEGAIAIVPSETKPARTKPMTNAEFERELALIRRQLTERGVPLVNRECMAAQEKAERIAAAMERERQAA